MTVEIKMVVDRGVDGSVFLKGLDISELRHRVALPIDLVQARDTSNIPVDLFRYVNRLI